MAKAKSTFVLSGEVRNLNHLEIHVEFTNNYFEIFGIPETFSPDLAALSDRYRELQKEFHPDRFAGKAERDRLLAVQWAATINQAFDTLKSPLKRAQYLLSLKDVDSSGEKTVSNDPVFLMEQMELREALAEVREQSDPFAALDGLRDRAQGDYRQQQDDFSQQFQQENYSDAEATVAKMQFLVKFLAEVELLEEQLDDE
ncbi:Fe-S protein assembly co-chaperone HscB [Porticoccaceae bacterium LTM1]|nr:Fe-S protein assembly co-chaperone HscB [Porticoccaceae bacterium LTM1]